MRATRRTVERGCRVLVPLLLVMGTMLVVGTMTTSPVTRAQPITFPHPLTLKETIGARKAFGPNGTGDISRVPASSNVILQPLPASQVRVSAVVALWAAQAAWGLASDQVDPRTGIVRAVISLKGDRLHHDLKAWLVVARLTTFCPAPGCNTMYSKMVIVVDARTGKAVFSYPADPAPTPTSVPAGETPPVSTIVSIPAMEPPPVATPPPLGVSPIGSGSARPPATAPPPPTPQTPGPWTGSGPAPTPTPTSIHA